MEEKWVLPRRFPPSFVFINIAGCTFILLIEVCTEPPAGHEPGNLTRGAFSSITVHLGTSSSEFARSALECGREAAALLFLPPGTFAV